MNTLNLNNRILLFAICTSIEFDLRKFLETHSESEEISRELFEKAKNRNPKKSLFNSTNNIEILIELDMGDLISIINSKAPLFNLSKVQKRKLATIFDKIIPIRNKVMHTKPIEFSDTGIMEEALYTIDKEITFIEWNSLLDTRHKIEKEPQKLIIETKFVPKIENKSNIYHNLPVPEYEDTGYIGRNREINDILELLQSPRHQIITIVGNGGIGKTAITVKSLQELLEKNNVPFEAILWISLKTRTISKGEFVNIKDAVVNISKLYSKLHKVTINETGNPQRDILNFMDEFPTLLVLDNLETIPTETIINFLKSIPMKSKVLITSRSGIGELEYRYVLKEMNLKDAKQYFVSLSKYYNLDLHKKNNDELIKQDLYSSPLSIKWYITSIYYGANESLILSNKDKLVEFSMSNIIENLTQNQIEMLWLLIIEGKTLSYGEIEFYINDIDEQELILNLNTLTATSMVVKKSDGNYEINDMAKEYLKIYRTPHPDFIKEIATKRRDLNRLLQMIKTKNEADPFNPKSLLSNLQNENTKIASIYLTQALKLSQEKQWEEADKLIQKAENVAPEYFEVYKIKAFINAENNNIMDAIESYRTAIENTTSDNEKASVYFLFSGFYTLKVEDYIKSLEYIDLANTIIPNNAVIVSEKARIHMYLGEFEESEMLFKSIDLSSNDTNKFKNQYASRLGELYRRMSNNYYERDVNLKFEYLKKAISVFEELEYIDPRTYSTLANVLNSLVNIIWHEPSKEMFISLYNKYYSDLSNNNSGYIKKLRNMILENKYDLPEDVVKSASKLGVNFLKEASEIDDKNKGIITKVTNRFGFIRNKYSDHYFNLSQVNYDNPSVGEVVSFDIGKNNKGLIALNIDKVVDTLK
ncbi:NB-ARC domain-containing protein [Alkalibacterium sp. MB6]|uniref:NB-ARC domain-containing protein n=1 Tax=Alkalibacterium sp. MB6 TaxID=2081965 RepID=UPI00137A9754|nr:NB-ARC domain-containing protein [Alkalibacterium sp. MB6]